jgi:hypothetical protein
MKSRDTEFSNLVTDDSRCKGFESRQQNEVVEWQLGRRKRQPFSAVACPDIKEIAANNKIGFSVFRESVNYLEH